MGNLLGVDFGSKNIGLALAPKSLLALRLTVLSNNDKVFKELARIIQEHQVEKIVVGLPLNLDSTKSKATLQVEKFVARLAQEFPELAIITQDERLSTLEAKRNLSPKVNIDAEAARIILQAYLDKSQKNHSALS